MTPPRPLHREVIECAGHVTRATPVVFVRGAWHAARYPWTPLKAHRHLNLWHLVGTHALAHEAAFSARVPLAETARHAARHAARLQDESWSSAESCVLRS